MNFFFLSIVLLLAASCNAEVEYKGSVGNCVIRHLKTIGRLKSDYPEFDVPMTGVDCEAELKKARHAAFKEVADEMRKDKDVADNVECVLGKFKAQKVMNDGMLKAIYRDSTVFPQDEKDRVVGELKQKMLDLAIDTVVECMTG